MSESEYGPVYALLVPGHALAYTLSHTAPFRSLFHSLVLLAPSIIHFTLVLTSFTLTQHKHRSTSKNRSIVSDIEGERTVEGLLVVKAG